MCFFFRLTLHPRRSTLFPYTTLFRSGLELRPLELEGRHVRIGVRDVGAPTEERADDLVRRRLPRVSHPALVDDAQHQDSRALQRSTNYVNDLNHHCLHDPAHRTLDMLSQRDEA